MKALVLFCALMACATALPATSKAPPSAKESTEDLFDTILTPMKSSEEDESTEVPSFFNPFNFFFNPIRFIPAFPDVGSIFRDITKNPSSNPDNKLTNSTVETKIIDGRKVVVNNSFYENKKTGMKIHTVLVNYDLSDETTISPVSSIPDKKTEENEVREELADSTLDNGDSLNA